MAAFYFRLCQVLALLYVTIFRKYVTLLYVLAYIIGNKLHNLMCFCDTLCDIIKIMRHIICNIIAKIIVKYFNTFALCIVNCSRFVQTKHKMIHLTTYQKFQYQRYGNILLQDGSSTQNPNDPQLLPKNYDYEDDDYTFSCWLENQSKLKIQDYEN